MQGNIPNKTAAQRAKLRKMRAVRFHGQHARQIAKSVKHHA